MFTREQVQHPFFGIQKLVFWMHVPIRGKTANSLVAGENRFWVLVYWRSGLHSKQSVILGQIIVTLALERHHELNYTFICSQSNEKLTSYIYDHYCQEKDNSNSKIIRGFDCRTPRQ